MILPASVANSLTNANIAQSDAFLLRTELYNINRDINKAIRKKRFNHQFAYLFTAAAVAELTTAGYTVTVNDYGQVVSWV